MKFTIFPVIYFVVVFQVLLAKHKTEDKFYAIKVLHKAAIRKRNEVCTVLVGTCIYFCSTKSFNLNIDPAFLRFF